MLWLLHSVALPRLSLVAVNSILIAMASLAANKRSRHADFSNCGLQALGSGSVAVAQVLSCPQVCEIFLGQQVQTMSPALAVDSLPRWASREVLSVNYFYKNVMLCTKHSSSTVS